MAGTVKTAEAGRRGSDVRSDCWVQVTLAESGGADLKVTSKVESMYGDSIRALVPEVLVALKVRHAKVEVEDAGALPFVLMARIEAAVRRLGLDVGEGYIPDMIPEAEYATQRERFRRSRLYLPGNEPKFLLNAGLHKPDGIILDLEDSVSPLEKDAARIVVRNALRQVDFYGAERMVRINQGERGLEDLDFVASHNVHVVLIPKVEHPEQVAEVDARIKAVQARLGVVMPVYLMPIVESAMGALRAYEIAKASDNVVALTIGLEDYTADICVQRTNKGRGELLGTQSGGERRAGSRGAADRYGLLRRVRHGEPARERA